MEDPARECGGDLGGPKLAPHAMVLRDRTTLERNSLGAPDSEGPVTAGTRYLVSPLPTEPETVGMAPCRIQGPMLEGVSHPNVGVGKGTFYLGGIRLPLGQVHILVWSPSGGPPLSISQHILQFLQEQLCQGKSAATLRGMVAAIKASQVGNRSL